MYVYSNPDEIPVYLRLSNRSPSTVSSIRRFEKARGSQFLVALITESIDSMVMGVLLNAFVSIL